MKTKDGIASRLLFTSMCVLTAATFVRAQADHRTWSDNGGGPDNSHFSALRQITKANVGQLEVAWSYPSNDTISYVWNPLIVDNVMYVLARNNSLVALDASTGKEIWIHEDLQGIAPRGINYWESKDRKDRRLIFQMNSYMQEVDARTGKSILTFGTDGIVNLRDGLRRYPTAGPFGRVQSNNPGKVFENLILLGSSPGEGFLAPPGDLRAFDVITGDLVWQFHTIPHPGEYGYSTWPKDAWRYAGGANTWGEITIDQKRGIAYFPTGSANYDFYGADRVGVDLFADCLIALDARTGKRLWHYQTIHHDLWDYDNTAAPQLITVRHNGKLVDAVAMAGKTGFLYVFNRVTGRPLWPIQERPVPKSDMPGEQASPTQPFPIAPPPFVVQKFTADDINPYLLSPEERSHWKTVVDGARNDGIFTPPSMRDTIEMPGNQGGANWGTTASNPTQGVVYVLGLNEPAILKMSEDMPARHHGGTPVTGSAVQGGAIYEQYCQACHGADRRGNGTYPSLVDVVTRLGVDTVRSTVSGGRGPMPAFSADIKAPDVDSLIAFLASSPTAEEKSETTEPQLGGPVVASGGAPAGKQLAAAGADIRRGGPYGPMGGPPYPEGLDVPANRYYTDYNVMGNIMKPPYTTLTAYDLNKGTIKWQVPVGDDLRVVREGVHDTGAIGIRVGMVVTSTGLVFMAGGDMKIRAYDTATGKVLWTASLPGQSRGIPAMYQVNGRQYLIVNATSPAGQQAPIDGSSAAQPRGYVAFALPQSGKQTTR
ncbi:MAG TPA: PQQ-binding-like beta-propeller repeat protein [Bryobacteraceae bacterium]|jgi:quinoprotein glucose dehydrogenase|nr:PQQ-binding-like beta-propeller repeat protein [Bryobacteraceae bacterium]